MQAEDSESKVTEGQISARTCQDRLVLVWSAGLVVTIVILVLQFSNDLFTTHETAAIAWCTQTFSPLLATMIAKYVGVTNAENKIVGRAVFRVAFFLSLVYLVLAVTFLCQSGSLKTAGTMKGDAVQRIAFLETRSLLLGVLMIPLGTLIAACFGSKVTSKKKTKT
jgi:uncharacterized membrane protein YozB (DUF420 family)